MAIEEIQLPTSSPGEVPLVVPVDTGNMTLEDFARTLFERLGSREAVVNALRNSPAGQRAFAERREALREREEGLRRTEEQGRRSDAVREAVPLPLGLEQNLPQSVADFLGGATVGVGALANPFSLLSDEGLADARLTSENLLATSPEAAIGGLTGGAAGAAPALVNTARFGVGLGRQGLAQIGRLPFAQRAAANRAAQLSLREDLARMGLLDDVPSARISDAITRAGAGLANIASNTPSVAGQLTSPVGVAGAAGIANLLGRTPSTVANTARAVATNPLVGTTVGIPSGVALLEVLGLSDIFNFRNQ